MVKAREGSLALATTRVTSPDGPTKFRPVSTRPKVVRTQQYLRTEMRLHLWAWPRRAATAKRGSGRPRGRSGRADTYFSDQVLLWVAALCPSVSAGGGVRERAWVVDRGHLAWAGLRLSRHACGGQGSSRSPCTPVSRACSAHYLWLHGSARFTRAMLNRSEPCWFSDG